MLFRSIFDLMLALLLRWIRALLISVGLLFLLVTAAPPRWYVRWLAGPWNDPRGPVLVVLGSDSTSKGLLGQSSYWRAAYAVLVWREGDVREVILSGDESITGPMRQFLTASGIPEHAIRMENHSWSTHENALLTAELLKKIPGPYVLLTSDFHMWRASRAFQKAGVEIRPRPFPDHLKRFNDWRWRWPVFLELIEESVKIVVYRARGWI